MTATLKMLGRTLLAVTVVAAFAVLAPAVAGASVANTALINADSVTTEDGITNSKGEAISLEQFAAENAGYKVTVASGAEWEAMSAEQFAQYQVLIVGDPICSETPESANKSAATWAPVVMASGGNKALVGTDPEDHYRYGGGGAAPTNSSEPATAGAEHLVQDGITYAGGVSGATGIYYDTSCSDPGGDLETLERLTNAGAGQWELSNRPPCGGNVQQIASVPGFNSGPTKLTDQDIEGWECSVHITFPRYPADWNPLAVATDTSTTPTCGTDPEKEATACGQAYVLVSGVGIVATSPNISLSPASHSDPEGGTHAVTATVVEEELVIPTVRPRTMVAAPGKQVTFAVSGINNGAKGTCTYPTGEADPECLTDGKGQVVYTYSDAHGAGNDTINASVVIRSSVQHATATEEWTPIEKPAPAPSPATTTTTTPTPKVSVLAFGAARLASSPPACVASNGYLATVAGKGIASVTFSVDGHKVAAVRHANRHGAFAARIKVHSAGRHHLTMHVVFTSAANTKPLTIRRTIARCAARPVITPRFTG